MNILVICHYGLYMAPDSSYVHAQIREYVRLGHRVRALVPIPWGKRDWTGSRTASSPWSADGVEIIPFRYLSLSTYGKERFNTDRACGAVRRQLSTLMAGFRPDVIHAHTLGLDSGIGKWLKTRLGVPLVVTTHGSDTTIPVNAGKLAFLRRCCEGVDTVVAVSNVLAQRLLRCSPTAPVLTIHNGFNAAHLAPETEKSPLSFLQVSNLIELKQVPVTLRAFAEIHQTYPQAQLTIIGQGPDRSALEQLCRDLQISESVTFTGQLPHKEVLARMGQTRFYIMPSVREGLAITYLEAMASGCITVGTATEGISEIIRHGETGFLVQPGDSGAIAAHILTCLSAPERAAQIAANGRNAALKLTWAANAKKLLSVFETLLKE